MTDPTTGPNDNALDAALRGMARPAVDPALREAHIAAALASIDAAPDRSAPDNVVSLASRRRARVLTLTAVAAAGLFIVGLGIGRASAPKAETPTAVKNAALNSAPGVARTAVEGCPELTLDATSELIATFGAYALYRTTDAAPILVVVDTAACAVVTRVTAPVADAG
jgi:hypothetical protein